MGCLSTLVYLGFVLSLAVCARGEGQSTGWLIAAWALGWVFGVLSAPNGEKRP